MNLSQAACGLAASLALMSASTLAPAATTASVDFAAMKAGDYAVEPLHTRILFSLSHLGFTTWYGDFAHASGMAKIDPAHPTASSVEVSVPAASISTTNATLDSELKGADWFDAAKFPAMTFKSRQITVTGPDAGEMVGDLTLHGVTRPLTLQVKFHGAGVNPLSHAYTAGFDATGSIERSDFGVAKYVPMVGDKVSLIISAAFERKAP